MRPFQEYAVWQLGHEIVLDVYAATKKFPREELYGLTSQMRRAAYSITMNVAEGSAKSDSEFHQALTVSLGSAAELEYQILLSQDLGYLPPDAYQALDSKVKREKRMLVSFMKALRPRPTRRPTANGQQPTARAGTEA
ncbi:MAG: four helix bundle protein [Dehalococcoidia bacterium]